MYNLRLTILKSQFYCLKPINLEAHLFRQSPLLYTNITAYRALMAKNKHIHCKNLYQVKSFEEYKTGMLPKVTFTTTK